MGGEGFRPTPTVELDIDGKYFKIDSCYFYSDKESKDGLSQYIFYYDHGKFTKFAITEELYRSFTSDYSFGSNKFFAKLTIP